MRGADKEATAAAHSDMPISNTHVPYRDWYPIIRSRIKQLWEIEWNEVNHNKLRQVKDNVEVWKADPNSRKNSIIITRLRIGHTRLTHQYLMEGREQPYCEDCLVPLTVKHFVAECPSHSDSRELFYPRTRGMSVEETLREILMQQSSGHFDSGKLVSFLIAIGLHDEIL